MIRKIARPMLASVYIADGVDTLLNTDAHVEATESVLHKVRTVLPKDYAKQIPQDPELVARVIGGTKVGAGSLLAIGKAPRISAGVLALTAIPTILGRHAFWETQDDEEKTARRSGFLTSIALLGGLGITSMDTQGKPGLAWRTQHAAKTASKNVQNALPSQNQAESALHQAGDWISAKASQAQDYIDDNKGDWKKAAQDAAGTASDWFDEAKKQAPKWADEAKDFFSQAEKDGSKALRKASKEGRDFLDDLGKDGKKAKKRVAKTADKAQTRAEKALDKAESKSGRAGKKAMKKAEKLQKQADKAINKAFKKLS